MIVKYKVVELYVLQYLRGIRMGSLRSEGKELLRVPVGAYLKEYYST